MPRIPDRAWHHRTFCAPGSGTPPHASNTRSRLTASNVRGSQRGHVAHWRSSAGSTDADSHRGDSSRGERLRQASTGWGMRRVGVSQWHGTPFVGLVMGASRCWPAFGILPHLPRDSSQLSASQPRFAVGNRRYPASAGFYFKTGTTSSRFRQSGQPGLRGHTNDVSRGSAANGGNPRRRSLGKAVGHLKDAAQGAERTLLQRHVRPTPRLPDVFGIRLRQRICHRHQAVRSAFQTALVRGLAPPPRSRLPAPCLIGYADLAARPVSAASRGSARDARRGRWNRRQALHSDRLPATSACAVSAVLDAPQRLTNLMKFGEAHLVELRQDVVILQFARALLRVAVVR